MSDLINRAYEFAAYKHRNQVRKYTGEPYITHPQEVACIVSMLPNVSDEMIAAALLHDTVEDTDTTVKNIFDYFGPVVAAYVYWLTDVSKPSDGNRAARKKLDREHMAKAPPHVKNIKLADMISNTRSIFEHDKKFAKVYLAEKQLLLNALIREFPPNEKLLDLAYDILHDSLYQLEFP